MAKGLYRDPTAVIYYALVKRGGKQFRKSLKTSDRVLANRLLAWYHTKVDRFSGKTEFSAVTFAEMGKAWRKTATV